MCRVVFLRSNPIDPDPRVEKEARVLNQAGYAVEVVGWDRTASLPREELRDFGPIKRLPIRAEFGSGLSNFPYLLRFQFGLIRHLVSNRKRYDIIHACDFDTLLPSLLAKLLFRKKVIYDIFDFYADMLLKVPAWIRRVLRYLDLKLMGLADAVILVDQARLEQIKGARVRKLAFVYNAPPIDPALFPPLPPPPPPFKVGFVGLLSVTRGILEMIEVVGRRQSWVMELAGFGGDEKEIVAAARRMSQVRFHGQVPYAVGLALSASSHVLFATYDPKVPNHRFSSANKLFEAMALGRPIIVAKGTSMDRLVTAYNLGYVVDYGDRGQLEEVLQEIETWSNEKWGAFSAHAKKVYKDFFSWENQAERLLGLYQQVLGSGC